MISHLSYKYPVNKGHPYPTLQTSSDQSAGFVIATTEITLAYATLLSQYAMFNF